MIFKKTKSDLKREIGCQSRFILIYSIILTAVPFISAVAQSIPYLMANPEISVDDLTTIVNRETPLYSIIAVIFGVAFILLKRQKKLFQYDLRTQNRPLPLQTFLICISLFFAAQMIFSISDSAIRALADFAGYAMYSTTDAIQETEDSWALLLYAGFLGPIVEEIVFRGIIMSGLRKYGKLFAIITSSVLFAFFHGDITQGIFAFFCGIILGYITTEYSIKWAMVLHIINNFIISDMLGRLIERLPSNIQDITSFLLTAIIGGLGLLILLKNRIQIKNYLHTNKTKKHTYLIGWTSIWFILYLGLQFISALLLGFVKVS